MQVYFVPEKGTADAVSILRLQERYYAKQKQVVCVFCRSIGSFSDCTKKNVTIGDYEEPTCPGFETMVSISLYTLQTPLKEPTYPGFETLVSISLYTLQTPLKALLSLSLCLNYIMIVC